MTGIFAKPDHQRLAAYNLKAVHRALPNEGTIAALAPEPSDATSEEAAAKPYAYQSDQRASGLSRRSLGLKDPYWAALKWYVTGREGCMWGYEVSSRSIGLSLGLGADTGASNHVNEAKRPVWCRRCRRVRRPSELRRWPGAGIMATEKGVSN